MISTTLFLVFFTTIVFGAVMPFVIKLFDKDSSHHNEENNHNEKDLFEQYEFQRYDKQNNVK